MSFLLKKKPFFKRKNQQYKKRSFFFTSNQGNYSLHENWTCGFGIWNSQWKTSFSVQGFAWNFSVFSNLQTITHSVHRDINPPPPKKTPPPLSYQAPLKFTNCPSPSISVFCEVPPNSWIFQWTPKISKFFTVKSILSWF